MGLLFFLLFLSVLGVFVWFSRRPELSRLRVRLIALVMGIGLFVVGFSSLLIVPSGQAHVGMLFGVVQDGEIYEEGVYLVNPLYTFAKYNVRRQSLDFRGADKLTALTHDGVNLTIDISVPWRLNPARLDQFHRVIGGRYASHMMTPIIRRSVRDAIADLEWAEAGFEDREVLSTNLETYISASVSSDLMSSGFSRNESQRTIEIYGVQVREVLPPQRILNAVAEKMAAEEDLARQLTLTEIAREEANRRAEEGRGVAKLFDELPEGFSTSDIRTILDAVSTKTRADSIQKAVDTGQVKNLVLFGDGSAGGNAAVPLRTQ